MENFRPKKIDISSINGGQRYENGQGVGAEAINAPIEASYLAQSLATNQPILEENGGEPNVVIENAETNPQFKFQNLKRQQEFDRIENEQNEQNERISNNEKNIQNIKAILTGNNQFVKITSSKAYTSRVTAHGANIFDDQLTPVLEIAGSTVAVENQGLKHANINSIVSTGKNLFDISKIPSSSTLINNGDGSITTTSLLTSTSRTLKEICPNIQVGINYTLTLDSDNSKQTTPLIYLIPKTSGVSNISWYKGATKSFTEEQLNSTVYIYGYLNGTSLAGQPCKTSNIQIQIGNVATAYTPYVEPSIFQLPETVMLPEYDKILPQTGELVRATGYATSETGFTDEEIATYNNAVVSNDRKSLVYELETPASTNTNAPKWYETWNRGTETIVQGETDNSKYGAMPKITQTYFGKVGE